MSKRDELASKHANTTVFTDETGNDEVLIHNMRFMAYGAGFDAAIDEVRKWSDSMTHPIENGIWETAQNARLNELEKFLDSLTKEGEK